MPDPEDREQLAWTLWLKCPARFLAVATPWNLLPEREREAWRVLADTARRELGPRPSDVILERIEAGHRDILRAVDLLPYVRHLDGCAQAPCSCGLDALLCDPP